MNLSTPKVRLPCNSGTNSAKSNNLAVTTPAPKPAASEGKSTPEEVEEAISTKQSTTPDAGHHCALPSSMLNLFSSQFELLERAVEDLRSLISRKFDAVAGATVGAPASSGHQEDFTARIASLEGKIDAQSTKLDGLHNDRMLLLQENTVLKEQLNGLVRKIEGMADSVASKCRAHDSEVEGKPGIPEYLMCGVQQGNKPPIFVAVIYRPPGVSYSDNSELANNLRRYSAGYDYRLVMGDLNANMLSTSHDAEFVRDLACELNLKLVNHGATHHVRDSHTWIDMIFTDDDNVVLSASNSPANFRSSHTIIDVEIYFQTTEPPALNSLTYRDFKSIKSDELLSLLAACDWSSVSCSDSGVDTRLEHLSQKLLTVIDQLAPLKEFKPRQKDYPPWVDAELRHLYSRRDALKRRHKHARRGSRRLDDLWTEYQALAAEAERCTNQAREEFIQNRIFDALENNKNVWNELRSLSLISKAKEDLHGFTTDELNTHFAGVSISDAEREVDLRSILAEANEDGFTFREVTFADVVLAVAHFSSQAKGEDGIPQSVIAKSLPVLGHLLVTLFNASLSCGVFPGAWKNAHLVPLKKKPIPSTVSDFRPIALLSFLSKVLEKIVHEQISDFLASKKILDPFQTGFRHNHSTQTALLKLTEDIRTGIDSDRQLLTILLMVSLELDPGALTVQHLHQRSPGGVGRFLGPKGLLTDSVAHLLYADDLQTYTQVTRDNLREGVDRMSAAARAVSDWASHNALHLNTGKTKAIIFGSEYNVNKLQGLNLPGVEVQTGVFVPFVDAVTNLGVVMDSKLTWKPQVDAVSRKVNRALYGLRSFRSCTNEALRKQLAGALVISHLDYCSVVYLDVSGELETRLQRLQNSCVRYICGVGRYEHISPYRRKLGWMNIKERRTYFMAVLMYKAHSMGQPPYLSALFEKNQCRTSGRSSRDITVPGTRTDTGLKSYRVQGARLWNSLPRGMRTLPSLSRFKLAMRNYLLPTISET
ncbi:uncharacterized protein LOC116415943 [Nasonia vitripennis]|uniref:Reverse transcriptase domain-containing protein n=1 Tax=Nasonia vitripennis TaxID=7425 RepID=A0A7M7PY06_NASVI|nr:uncharacterized protein LOC116415943 [Nasonia vitripennis]